MIKVLDHIIPANHSPLQVVRGDQVLAELNFGEACLVALDDQGLTQVENGGAWVGDGAAYLSRLRGITSVSLASPDLDLEAVPLSPLSQNVAMLRLRMALALSMATLNGHLGHNTPTAFSLPLQEQHSAHQ